MDPIERIERATAFAAGKVKGVTPDDLTKPTPCSEFDVCAYWEAHWTRLSSGECGCRCSRLRRVRHGRFQLTLMESCCRV